MFITHFNNLFTVFLNSDLSSLITPLFSYSLVFLIFFCFINLFSKRKKSPYLFSLYLIGLIVITLFVLKSNNISFGLNMSVGALPAWGVPTL